MTFLPYGNSTSFNVLFLCRDLISSCIVVMHKEISKLFKVLWKVDGSQSFVRRQYATLIYVTYYECHTSGGLSRVNRRTYIASNSTSSCSSSSGATSEESESSFPDYFPHISVQSLTFLL